ncbi:MAG: hypothetical protein GF364_01740 [Candidatus Lokiarchaeota archaeon]|nr:hypothetical protein [Candidatus Lokiarchaeota archaeon]
MDICFDLRNLKQAEYKPKFNMEGFDPNGNHIQITKRCFEYNGNPIIPVMGEIHFSRCEKKYWEESILKMKACGINMIATYIFWIHHEEIQGEFDWTGNRNLHEFLKLCKKHKVWVHLRIGPFCHGEVRNGGIPDWAYRKNYTRKNHPKWLMLTRNLYKQIFLQLEGLFYKQGGPVVAIQLENEYHRGKKGIPYIKALKRIAVDCGIDVPYYTCTGWGQEATIPEKEVLPTFGGYVAAPWAMNHRRFKPEEKSAEFIYKHYLPRDVSIGIRNTEEEIDYLDLSEYPRFTCEIGSGIQITHHRRPNLNWSELLAIVNVRVGEGVNLVGYYMFHGGSNPVGKLTKLHESPFRPSLLVYPKFSYDFQAPIGEFLHLNLSYRYYKVFNYFLNHFGSLLATAKPFFPKQEVSSVTDIRYPRTILRSNGENKSSFLFVNTCDRYFDNTPDFEQVQFTFTLKDQKLVVPHDPVTIKKDSTFIWPLFFPIGDSKIIFASVQPIFKIKHKNISYYYFMQIPGYQIEFMLDSSCRVNSVAGFKRVTSESGIIFCNFSMDIGDACLEISLNSKTDQKTVLKTVSLNTALNLWKVYLWKQERIIYSTADIRCTPNTLYITYIAGSNRDQVTFDIYPPINDIEDIKTGGASLQELVETTDSSILPSTQRLKYNIRPKTFKKLKKLNKLNVETKLVKNNWVKRKWEVIIPPNPLNGRNDVFLEIDYIGDSIELYLNDVLVWDDFNRGVPVQIGLKRWKDVLPSARMYLVIKKISRMGLKRIYTERLISIPKYKWKYAQISSIKVKEEYEIALSRLCLCDQT